MSHVLIKICRVLNKAYRAQTRHHINGLQMKRPMKSWQTQLAESEQTEGKRVPKKQENEGTVSHTPE